MNNNGTNLQRICRDIRSKSAANIASIFGLDGHVVSMVLSRRFTDANGKKYEEKIQLDNLVLKKENASQYSPKFSNVTAKDDSFELTGIDKSLSLDWLQATGVSFWVEAQLINNRIVGGWEGEFVTLDRKNPLAYTLFLRKKPDERRFT